MVRSQTILLPCSVLLSVAEQGEQSFLTFWDLRATDDARTNELRGRCDPRERITVAAIEARPSIDRFALICISLGLERRMK